MGNTIGIDVGGTKVLGGVLMRMEKFLPPREKKLRVKVVSN